MENLSSLTQEEAKNIVYTIGLVSARMVGFFSIAPIFGSKAVPRNIRAGLIMTLALVVQPAMPSNLYKFGGDAMAFFAVFSKELFVGFVFGMVVWLPLRGIEYAGVLLDTQRGSMQATDNDIIFNAQTTPTAVFLTQTLTMYFFAVGGFLTVCRLLFESYSAWPILEFYPRLEMESTLLFLSLAGKLLLVSVIFILPISIFMFLADIAIAFIAKAAPTLNAMTFSMPVKSGLAVILLFAYMHAAFPAALEHFDQTIPMIERVLFNVR